MKNIMSFFTQKRFWLVFYFISAIVVIAVVIFTHQSSPAIPTAQETPTLTIENPRIEEIPPFDSGDFKYNWIKYTNKQIGYEFEYPNNWRVRFLYDTVDSPVTINSPNGAPIIQIEIWKAAFWPSYEEFAKTMISYESVTNVTKTKATLHYLDAISFVDCEGGVKGGCTAGEAHTTIFGSPNQYFQISYINAETDEFEDIYQHVLSNFILLNI
ncbi:MAG: hypothetical protein ABIJ05_00605 [Patescibacteria group bacterium]